MKQETNIPYHKKEGSKVYFTDFRSHNSISMLQKLEHLISKAGIDQIDFKNKYVAIKIHFGEPGNVSYLRPNFAKVVVDYVKSKGGKPFLTDCNTLYVGRRKNALDHLDAAYENGFTPYSTGCQVIIADGLKGTDEQIVPIDMKYVTEAKIGRAIMDADIVISLNHFKGHEMAGFGGALKNIGMGCGSRAGKMEMHSSEKPYTTSKCVGCKRCIHICAHDAISMDEHRKAHIDHNKCVGCGRCLGVCNFDAIEHGNNHSNDIMNYKIAEYTHAVIKDKPNFHINLIMDVSPNCDCHAENDLPIVPNLGMLASFDPVALDKACIDLVNQAPVIKGSMLEERQTEEYKEDVLTAAHHDTNWREAISYAEEIGLGSCDYDMVTLK